MAKFIKLVIETEGFTISGYSDGYWLWDSHRKMNLSMRAKTVEEAFTEALEFYQERLAQVEKKHAELSAKVNGFLALFQTDN